LGSHARRGNGTVAILRARHITHAIESGVPIEVVMAQVGHLSAEMTRYYTHLGPNAKHAAVAAVEKKAAAAVAVLEIASSVDETQEGGGGKTHSQS